MNNPVGYISKNKEKYYNVMYYLKRIKEVSTDFYQNVRFFNVKVAVTKTLVPKLCKDSDKMHQAILNYLEPRYADLVQSYVGLEQSSSIVLTDDCPIWVCWLQGGRPDAIYL